MLIENLTTTETQITKDDLINLSLTKIKGSLQATYVQNVTVFNDVYNELWSEKDGITPQDRLNALGTDAAELFNIALAFGQAINSIHPDSVPLQPKMPVTVHEDGTVTIN